MLLQHQANATKYALVMTWPTDAQLHCICRHQLLPPKAKVGHEKTQTNAVDEHLSGGISTVRHVKLAISLAVIFV